MENKILFCITTKQKASVTHVQIPNRPELGGYFSNSANNNINNINFPNEVLEKMKGSIAPNSKILQYKATSIPIWNYLHKIRVILLIQKHGTSVTTVTQRKVLYFGIWGGGLFVFCLFFVSLQIIVNKCHLFNKD